MFFFFFFLYECSIPHTVVYMTYKSWQSVNKTDLGISASITLIRSKENLLFCLKWALVCQLWYNAWNYYSHYVTADRITPKWIHFSNIWRVRSIKERSDGSFVPNKFSFQTNVFLLSLFLPFICIAAIWKRKKNEKIRICCMRKVSIGVDFVPSGDLSYIYAYLLLVKPEFLQFLLCFFFFRFLLCVVFGSFIVYRLLLVDWIWLRQKCHIQLTNQHTITQTISSRNSIFIRIFP